VKVTDSVQVPLFTGLQLVRAAADVAVPARRLRTPSDCAQVFREVIGDSATEIMAVAGLTSQSRCLGVAIVARGGFSSCEVDPRVLFTTLLMMGAVNGFILCHNHPSGDPTPSAQDVALTRQISSVAVQLGMRCLDHLVIGEPRNAGNPGDSRPDTGWVSMLCEGLMSGGAP
jgi:DNA repair protein RadC